MLFNYLVKFGLLHCFWDIFDKNTCIINGNWCFLRVSICIWFILRNVILLLIKAKSSTFLSINFKIPKFSANLFILFHILALDLKECRHKFLIYIMQNLWWIIDQQSCLLLDNLSNFL